MHHDHDSPADHHRLDTPVTVAPAPVDSVRPWRWTTGTIAAAALFLAVFNAHAIGGWFDELTPGPLTAPLGRPVAGWTAATAGLDRPRRWLRAQWLAAQARRFGHEQPGQQGAAAGGP